MTPFKEPKHIAAASAAQRGAVLPTVMIMMMVLTMMGVAVLEYTGLSEVREVEKSLADVRAYWAMMGHFNYMASRASEQGLCSSSAKGNWAANVLTYCQHDYVGSGTPAPAATTRTGLTSAAVAGSLQDYLDHETSSVVDELQNGTIVDPGVAIWTYPVRNNASFSATHNGSSASNQFSVWGMVRPRDADNLAPSTNSEDGLMIMDLELERISSSADTSITALRDIGKRVARLMIGFCVYDSEDTGSSTYNNKGCGATASGVTPATEGAIKIEFIQRAENCTTGASGSCASY